MLTLLRAARYKAKCTAVWCGMLYCLYVAGAQPDAPAGGSAHQLGLHHGLLKAHQLGPIWHLSVSW